jgi:hypothetical protein
MELSAQAFAQKTWGRVALGDSRLNARAVKLGERMTALPEGSLARQVKNNAELEGAYDLLNNRSVTLPALLAPTYAQTRQRASQGGVVLWVNDATELDYTFHAATGGLGPIGTGRGRGLLMHSTLAVVPQTREVLGLGNVEIYLREPTPKPEPKWTRSMEGRVWGVATQAVGRAPEGVTWVAVSDAGSNSFVYWSECVRLDKHFLIRVAQNRWVCRAGDGTAVKLVDYARSLPAVSASERTVDIPARQGQGARQAQVVLAWAGVQVIPSAQGPKEERQLAPFAAWVLRVWEPGPPPEVKALEWILLSSLPVTTLAEADERIEWYTCRWLCEDFHQCLKTGCAIERSQLNDRGDIEALLGFAAPIAVRLLQLRQAARQPNERPAREVVEPLMVEVLALRMDVDGQSMSLRLFWRLVARLGGFLGRKGDGHPGWRTVWWGYRYLSDLTEGARLVNDHRTKLR